MPKYSFRYIQTEEYIKTIDTDSLENAILFFAKLKSLDLNTFNKLYEVIKR